MNRLFTLLALLIGALLVVATYPNVKNVDNLPEILREMAELRDTLQACEAAKSQAVLETKAAGPVPGPSSETAPVPTTAPSPETVKQRCMREADRLGNAALLAWYRHLQAERLVSNNEMAKIRETLQELGVEPHASRPPEDRK